MLCTNKCTIRSIKSHWKELSTAQIYYGELWHELVQKWLPTLAHNTCIHSIDPRGNFEARISRCHWRKFIACIESVYICYNIVQSWSASFVIGRHPTNNVCDFK